MRILTVNIRGGLGIDGRRSTARIAEVIAACSADIVCLQEVHQRVPWSGFIDQPRRLRHLLGMPVLFQRCLNLGIGGEGIAVATCLPVLFLERHVLPSEKERRGALEVGLQTPQGPLRLFCTHWGLNSQERRRQAERMIAWIRRSPHPVVVCGDLNDPPDRPSVQTLLAGAALCDTFLTEDAPTYPAEAPRLRIDYILHTHDLRRLHSQVVKTAASDHYAILTDLALQNP